jgi:hypothetical protein
MILEEYFLFHILMGAKSILKISFVVRKKTVSVPARPLNYYFEYDALKY